MRLHDLSLVTRVTIGVMAMVVAGTATLLLVENTRLRDAYLSERRAHLEKDLEAEKLLLNQAINTLRQDVLFLSNTPPVSGIVRAVLNHGYDPRYGNTSRVWEERLQQIFSAFANAHQDYYRIRYIGVGGGGREIVGVDNLAGNVEVMPFARFHANSDRGYFKATLGLHTGEVHLSEFNLNRESDVIEHHYRPTLRAATPVFTPSGEMFGMVVIDMDAGSLLKSAVSDLPGVQTYMANENGQYLLHPDSQQAFKFEPDAASGSKDKITADFRFTQKMLDSQAPDYLPLQAVAAGTSNPLFTARRIYFDPGNPSRFLLLMHYLPEAVAEQQIATISAQTIIYEFLVMLLVGGMATLALRRTFSPLRQITVAADKIAAGDQNTLLLPTGGGEIGSLTRALNTMLTSLAQREKLLQESEARYRRLHESMVDAYVMVDMSGRLLEFNHTYREMLGYSADELQHMNCVGLTPEKWHEFEARIIEQQVIPHGYSQVYEKEYIRKDGTVFPVEFKAFLLRDKNDQPEAMWAIVRDITGRKQAENTLHLHSEILKNLSEGIFLVRASDGVIVFTNPQFERMFGYESGELLGKHVSVVNAPGGKTPGAVAAEIMSELKRAGAWDGELRNIRKDGTIFWCHASVSTFEHSQFGKVWVSVHENITERKRVERRLHDLTAHLQSVREEEKASIAREIHDDLGGVLTAMKMEAYWLKAGLPANKETIPLLGHVAELSQLIDNAAGMMRKIITGLRPAILDDLGLLAALEWQAAQFHKHTGIECRVNSVCAKNVDCATELDKARSIALFRISQEALNNVARHSGASSVEIEFYQNDEEVVMSVIDNGRGMAENRNEVSIPYGILGMSERVDQLGGKISFDTPPGGGFNVTVILPLPGNEGEET